MCSVFRTQCLFIYLLYGLLLQFCSFDRSICVSLHIFILFHFESSLSVPLTYSTLMTLIASVARYMHTNVYTYMCVFNITPKVKRYQSVDCRNCLVPFVYTYVVRAYTHVDIPLLWWRILEHTNEPKTKTYALNWLFSFNDRV